MDWISLDVLSMLLVGALWGCTNPLLRKGSSEAGRQPTDDSFLAASLKSFLNVRVWLPYALNQSGSIVFYVLLASSDISTAVPICNAMALLFSFATSSVLGEPIEKPLRTAVGAFLVLLGVTICVSSQEEEEKTEA